MKLLKISALAALAIISGSVMGQTAVGGANGASLRLGFFDGSNYSATGNVASLASMNIIAVGNFVSGNTWDVIVHRTDTNRYLRWSFDALGNRIATDNIREAIVATGAGVGDFDGNGNLEFVVVDGDGRAFAYELNSVDGTFWGRKNLGVVTTAALSKVVGVADCDNDGDSDLVLQDPATKDVQYRYFNGSAKQGLSGVLSNTPGGAVVGASNNGGGLQLHIKSASTGAIRVWHMDGITRVTNLTTNGWNANWTMTVGN